MLLMIAKKSTPGVIICYFLSEEFNYISMGGGGGGGQNRLLLLFIMI